MRGRSELSGRRFYESPATGARRSAPAALRNREPIADVLADWLPARGTVLEIASGTGEHAAYFAKRFPDLQWLPSDVDEGALLSISAWRVAEPAPNLLPPIVLDAAAPVWPVGQADAIVSINMVHISPWQSALGLIDGAARLLPPGGPLILYGPWLSDAIDTAPSNVDFDASLKARNSAWGLRRVEDFAAVAHPKALVLSETRDMPANNLMLLFRRN